MGDSFHEYEWNKHGVCYMNLITGKYGDKFSEDEIFKTYLSQAVEKAQRHRTVNKYVF